MPATSLPAFGSLTPSATIFSPWIAGVRNSAICSFVPRPHGHASHPSTNELFALRDREPEVAAAAAVLFGVVRGEDAELTRPLEHLVREGLGFLPSVDEGVELLLGELANGGPELLVLFAVGARHEMIRTRNISSGKPEPAQNQPTRGLHGRNRRCRARSNNLASSAMHHLD